MYVLPRGKSWCLSLCSHFLLQAPLAGDIRTFGTIDIEAMGTGHGEGQFVMALLEPMTSQWPTPLDFEFSMEVHARYQQPSHDGAPTLLTVPPPRGFVKCVSGQPADSEPQRATNWCRHESCVPLPKIHECEALSAEPARHCAASLFYDAGWHELPFGDTTSFSVQVPTPPHSHKRACARVK